MKDIRVKFVFDLNFDVKKFLFLILTIAAAVAVYQLAPGWGLDPAAPDALLNKFEAKRRMLVIFVLAIGFWGAVIIPPYATALLIIGLEIMLLGKPGGGPLAADHLNPWKLFLQPAASPVLLLFLGGLVLASAATKYNLDLRMAKILLTPFGTRPSRVLLGVICITALFSMFMSNTATTAMMLAVIAPLMACLPSGDEYKKALALAVPFAANIGGMGTIIGTPPNAVAVSQLANSKNPITITFVEWMTFGVPIVIVLLGALYLLLIWRFKSTVSELTLPNDENENNGDTHVIDGRGMIVYSTFAITVLLWLTSSWHHIPTAVVALFPCVILTATKLIDKNDLNNLEWNVLLLVGGGIALGVGVQETGLAQWLIQALHLSSLTPHFAIFCFIIAAIVLSNFMSNTAAANLLIPLIITFAASRSLAGKGAVVVVALAASLAMSLPISTPPNAIASASGLVKTRDFLVYGTIISVCGTLLVSALMFWFVG